MAAMYVISEEMKDKIENSFMYHVPFGDQADRYGEIREAGRQFMVTLAERCPPSAELTLALREAEMAVMRANQSIALNEKPAVMGG